MFCIKDDFNIYVGPYFHRSRLKSESLNYNNIYIQSVLIWSRQNAQCHDQYMNGKVSYK